MNHDPISGDCCNVISFELAPKEAGMFVKAIWFLQAFGTKE
jgi:hypothetical protein